MTAALNVLEGHRARVIGLSDQLTLEMDHGWTLAIYNRFTLKSSTGNDLTTDSMDGCLITKAADFGGTAVIAFDNGTALSVDLSNEGFSGPEAMQLTGPGGEIVIWN